MIVYFIIVAAIAARFVPHLANFAPITALAIFGAANLDWKKSVGITLAVRFISDIFLGFFSWPLMAAVYAAHLAGVLFGVWIKKSSSVIPASESESISESWILKQVQDDTTKKWLKIVASSLGASAVFFLVTNFAFLYADYSHNISGIILAYTNGLPFLKGTLLGDLGYTVALFGSLAVAKYLAGYKTLNLKKLSA